ncbi:hypothetical protein BDN70DRAFT_888702 [Pholiota conissans]|uniref:Fungal-type protein kinase domain-containing protein n=1 Tax=Pholiota conissans TaxID=109636 RepID=A0A9P5YKN0_9AGAR|nr:hypothetical protein BDN70DRAFT_888702 [Pholiota conissans]
MPSSKGAFDNVPQPQGGAKFKETSMNGPLTDALNAEQDGIRRCPGYIFVNTGDREDGKYGSKPEISAYMEGSKETKADPGWQQIIVAIRLVDFACDKPAEGNRFLFDHLNNVDQEAAEIALGQQTYYATEICARQHRNFLFSIFVTPTHARFLRWDRAGVIISESFNYREEPEILCDFFWRFGHMSHEQRGGDTSVEWATKGEEELFKRAIKDHLILQLGKLSPSVLEVELKRHYVEGVVTKIPVRTSMRVQEIKQKGQANARETDGSARARSKARSKTSGKSSAKGMQKEAEFEEIHADPEEIVTFDENSVAEEYLVSHPVASPSSLVSSGTRGYWAVRARDKAVHFLKDAWRTDVEGMEVEGRILQKLAAKKVPNVPTVLCWSDVSPVNDEEITVNGSKVTVHSAHCTQTDLYKNADWNTHKPSESIEIKLTRRVHYRQITKEAGYTLEQLNGTYELLKGARDVFTALRDAHSLCNRFHRDVSSTNIILFADESHPWPQRRAILSDWERPFHVADDVESLIYVIFYCAIHFLPWNNYSSIPHREINTFFFHQHGSNGTGGVGKRANLWIGDIFASAKFEFVSDWLAKFFVLMRSYAMPDMKASSKEVFDAYSGIFDREDAYWSGLPTPKNWHHFCIDSVIQPTNCHSSARTTTEGTKVKMSLWIC